MGTEATTEQAPQLLTDTQIRELLHRNKELREQIQKSREAMREAERNPLREGISADDLTALLRERA